MQRLKRLNAILNLEEEEEIQPDLYFKIATSIIESEDLLEIYSLVPRDKEQVPIIDSQLHFFAVIGLEGDIREQITDCLRCIKTNSDQINMRGVSSLAGREIKGLCLERLRKGFLKKTTGPTDQLLINKLLTALT